MTLFELYTYVKAFQSDLVPPSSGCSLVMPTRTLSFPFHAITVSDCHRITAPLSPVAAGFGLNRLDVKRRTHGGGDRPLHSGFISDRDGRPTFDVCKGRSACCSQQMAAACSMLQSVPFHTYIPPERNSVDVTPVCGCF